MTDKKKKKNPISLRHSTRSLFYCVNFPTFFIANAFIISEIVIFDNIMLLFMIHNIICIRPGFNMDVLYCIVLYCIVLHCIALHCIARV